MPTLPWTPSPSEAHAGSCALLLALLLGLHLRVPSLHCFSCPGGRLHRSTRLVSSQEAPCRVYGAHSHEDACALARAPEWVVCYLRTADVNCRMSSALRSVGGASSPSFTPPGTAFEYEPGA